MTSRVIPADDIYKRYETHHKKILTLIVTRQNQEFVISDGITLSDLKLFRSSVELVGEPGFGLTTQVGSGVAGPVYDSAGGTPEDVYPMYNSTFNRLYAINASGSSTVKGLTAPNAVVHKPSLNHGWVSVEIDGMTQGRSFMRDTRYNNNQVDLVLPTDSGIIMNRETQRQVLPYPIQLENIQLSPVVRVNSFFVGTAPKQTRVARFVEDYADENPSTLRNADGTVKFYDTSSPGNCQIPSNMISTMVLQFEVMPRSTV